MSATVDLMKAWAPAPAPVWVTAMPSTRSGDMVRDFAQRLADALQLPFVDCLRKTRVTEPQKLMQNSAQQLRNVAGAFSVDPAAIHEGVVLLVDDMVDSRWSLTEAARTLRLAGVEGVVPFGLADSSTATGS